MADPNKLLSKFENMDILLSPSTKRFSLIEKNVQDALSAYKQTDEKQKEAKQTTMDIFLKGVTPQGGPR